MCHKVICNITVYNKNVTKTIYIYIYMYLNINMHINIKRYNSDWHLKGIKFETKFYRDLAQIIIIIISFIVHSYLPLSHI